MNHILNYLEGQKGIHMTELFDFLKFKSISSDPAFKNDVSNCADWLANHIKNIGFEHVETIPTKGHPIVYAEWMNAGENAKTVLIYGHYDVQPVDPLDLWTSDPFEPEIRNNRIFARGASDDKGQLFTHLKAIEAHFKSKGKLPINVKLLIEGEEEAESHLEEFIRANPEKLKADLTLISDTEWFAEGYPSICYALRGICFMEVFVTGPNRDLHSGTFGGAVDNPIQVLAWMVSQLKDKYGRISIPGFYDNVKVLSADERANFKKLPFDDAHYMKDLDVDAVDGEIGYSTLERTWIRPSLDLNGIKGGYIGEGAKTVLPSKASAKISMRLVPHQDYNEIAEKFEAYIKSIAPPTVKVEIKKLHGGNPVVVPYDSEYIKVAVESLKSAFGKDVVFMREGGSIPIVGIFDTVLGAPSILMGHGLPSDNIHSPNENFDIDNFYSGIKASAIFLEKLSKI